MFTKILLIVVFISLSDIIALSQKYNPDILENILERISFETGTSPELDAIENIN